METAVETSSVSKNSLNKKTKQGHLIVVQEVTGKSTHFPLLKKGDSAFFLHRSLVLSIVMEIFS